MTGVPETAAQLDRFIDDLLRDEPRPRSADGEGELAATARLLRESLPRFHPRFAFTERLATRLAVHAADDGAPLVADVIPMAAMAGPFEEVARGGEGGRRRELLAGGAIASGLSLVLPLAGAALLRWRRSRDPGNLA